MEKLKLYIAADLHNGVYSVDPLDVEHFDKIDAKLLVDDNFMSKEESFGDGDNVFYAEVEYNSEIFNELNEEYGISIDDEYSINLINAYNEKSNLKKSLTKTTF